jgi:hypothetical protein
MKAETKTSGPQPSSRQKRHFALRILVAVLSLPLIVGLAIGGLFVAASRGPVELSFLSNRLAENLQHQLGSGPVSIGRTILTKEEARLSLHVESLEIRNRDGTPLLSSPDAEIAFDPTRLALLSFTPRRLSLNRVAFVAPKVDQSASNSSDAGRALIGMFAFLVERSDIGLPIDLEITDSRFDGVDRLTGKVRTLEHVNLRVRNPAKRKITLEGSGRMDAVLVPLSAELISSDQGFELHSSAGPIEGSGLTKLLALPDPIAVEGGQARKLTKAKLALDGRVISAETEFVLEQVKVTGSPLVQPGTAFASLAARVKWSEAPGSGRLLQIAGDGEGIKFDFVGPIIAAATAADLHSWTPEGSLELGPLKSPEQPALSARVSAQITVSQDFETIKATSVKFDGHGGLLTLNASLERRADGQHLTGDLKAERLPPAITLRYWPTRLSPELRSYFIQAILGGEVRELTGQFSISPSTMRKLERAEAVPIEAFRFAATLENMEAILLPGLPKVTGLSMKVEANPIEANASAPLFAIQGADKALSLSNANLHIKALDTWTPQALLRARLAGPVEPITEWLRQPAQRKRVPAGVDLATLRGQIDGTFQLAFALGDASRSPEPALTGEARLSGISLDKVAGTERFQNGNLQMRLQSNIVGLKGEAQWRQIPVALDIEQDARSKALQTRATLKLDEAGLQQLGISKGIRTRTPLSVVIRNQAGSDRTLVETDLTSAELRNLVPGLQKAAGRPASLKFAMSARQGGFVLDDLALDAGTASLRGQVEVRADGAVQSAKLSTFKLSNGDSARLDYDQTTSGGRIAIRGANFDARPFLQRSLGKGSEKPDPIPDFDLDLQTALLSGYGGQVITSAVMRSSGRNGALRSLSVDGKLNGQKVAIAGRSERSDGLPVELDIDDAGAFLKYLDLYTRMSGGRLDGTLTLGSNPTGPMRLKGSVIVRDFALVNEPALRRMTQQAQAEGRGAVDQGQAKFTKLRAEFERRDNSIALKEAVLFGPEVGLTLTGRFDPVADTVAMSGTFIPAYGLNNAFGQIPIVGALLSGGRNEGLLGVTFGVRGRFSQPAVTINPLSAVAPGIFRRIFDFRSQDESPAVGSTGGRN